MCVRKQKRRNKVSETTKREANETQSIVGLRVLVCVFVCDMCEYAILSAVKIEKENVNKKMRREEKHSKAMESKKKSYKNMKHLCMFSTQ